MKKALQLILLLLLALFAENFSAYGNGSRFSEMKSLRPQDLKPVNKAFNKIWRKLGLDEVAENDNFENPTKASIFVEPLPFYDMQGVCNGDKLLLFRFANFFLISKNGSKFSVAEGYTGSSGTRVLIFSYNSKADTLKVVYDGNVIEVLGVLKSKDHTNCPDIGLVLSGSSFQNAKSNNEYGEALLKYSTNKSGYNLDL